MRQKFGNGLISSHVAYIAENAHHYLDVHTFAELRHGTKTDTITVRAIDEAFEQVVKHAKSINKERRKHSHLKHAQSINADGPAHPLV